jgi:hypothetical protein
MTTAIGKKNLLNYYTLTPGMSNTFYAGVIKLKIMRWAESLGLFEP